MSERVDATTRSCQNCGTPLLGDHCYACGQPLKGLVRHFGSILGDFVDSVFDLDSRMLRTIGPLLLRPGRLSLEYFHGHRVRYVSPVRLFVFLCLAAFFVLKLVLNAPDELAGSRSFDQADSVAAVEQLRTESLDGLQLGLQELGAGPGRAGMEAGIAAVNAEADERIKWLKARDAALATGEPPPPPPGGSIWFDGEPWHPQDNPIQFDALPEAANAWLNGLAARGKDNIQRVQQNPGLLKDAFLGSLPQTFFLLLPLFALLLKLMYLFKRRLYMEHLIVALHSHAFLCIAVLLIVALDQGADLAGSGWLHATLGYLEIAVAAWMPLYLWLMQKRVYRQGILMTSLKYSVIGVLYLLLLSIGATFNLLYSLVAM